MYSDRVIHVRLDAYLKQHGITPYKLAKTMQEMNGGKPSTSAVYAIVEGKNTPSLDTVNTVLNALARLRGQIVPMSAILEHEVEA